MNQLDMNHILNRSVQEARIRSILNEFETNKSDLSSKKGIYIYGGPGVGKTVFITKILKSLNYDIIKYDAGDVRNASVIEDITKHNMSDKNIMSLFNKKAQKIAIIMDEIDGMNNGDKGGINSLIKLIRPKKTKKQKLEEVTINPIICIGNYRVDKKIKELIKVCNTVELCTPTNAHVLHISESLFTSLDSALISKIVHYVQGDLRKLDNMYNLYLNKPDIFACNAIDNIFQLKSYNDDTKHITHKLLHCQLTIEDHNLIMNETDRTSVGLLWHENVIDAIDKYDKRLSIPFYIQQLNNICLADYIDRTTFQKQIWQFNEMSSLIKTFKNNKLFHSTFTHTFGPLRIPSKDKCSGSDMRFTKVLTKYSTEYNNSLFIQKLCQKLGMDKKDLFGFFMELSASKEMVDIIAILEPYDISKLDVNRIYRYIEKYIKENAAGVTDKLVEDDDDLDTDE